MTVRTRKAAGARRSCSARLPGLAADAHFLMPLFFFALFAILSAGFAYADGPAAKADDSKPASAKPAQKDAKPAASKDKPAEKKDAPAAKDSKPAEKDATPAPAKNAAADKKETPSAKDSKPADMKPAPEKAKPAKAEAKPVDVDLAIQGEFIGSVSVAPNRFQQIGLQIRAAGGGSFEAAQYRGGLPARPLGEKDGPTLLVGKRHDDFLVLSGGPWAVFVEPGGCMLVDRHGNRVGRLERVHRQSPTLGAKPPKDAIVLFDGKGTDQFTRAQMADDGLLMEGADVKPLFTDFNLHLEFKLPYMPEARGQARGNSGIYLQSRYEVQVLDSFAIEPEIDGCGALYKFRKPDVNMCFPPLVWQTYDIVFTSARWDADGSKRKPARLTVWQNGVKIQNNVELPSKTGRGQPEEATLLPILFQDHHNPVRYRNIWIIDRGAAPPVRFPVLADKDGADKK